MNAAIRSSPAAPGRVTWQCACFNVRKAARAVTRFYDEALAPSGLKATQLTVLGAISISGSATMSALADMLSLDKTTLTRNIKLLEKAGLILAASGDDRRERIVSLSEAGDTALQRALPLWREAQRRLAEHVGHDDWHRVLDIMSRFDELILER